ncbi:MAG TPA: cytochrome b N-terminal domain-containing protein [Caldisericia bacterium]|nr:cytochrome b N-terminal domain-containing protein [Caldisericia bacterium]HPF48868.1 cytochrome b N-terminal domain-containing protein [Caldisericia bacterium]HPI83268.1 cytochrome b N-terminal domain-containing protein [Caldisericia bacterium]HPQ92495.1 cytochrome b N-terminal domain-containing protein [Caldisericia bacterium]HRV74407.1 cytochrome b N-terminal domain-containing protein [Caldisericia bacterium]
MSLKNSYRLSNPFNFVINGTLGIFDTLKVGFASINPLNHLGSLTLLFFLVQILSGFILSFFYMPSLEHANNSVKYIMSDMVPYGLFIRTLHRYAADAMIIFATLHMFRKFFANRHTSTRSVGWYVGVGLLVFTVIITISGYILPMDARADAIVSFFGLSINSVTFLIIYRAIHVALPILVFAMLVVHFFRISRPPIIPTLALTIISLGFVAVLIGLFPIPADEMKMKLAKYSFDWVGLWTIKLPSVQISQVVWGGIVGILLLLPFVGKKIKNAAVVDPWRCSGCLSCKSLCPKNAIVEKQFNVGRGKSKKVAFVIRKKCQACGVCVAGCLPQVIELEGRKTAPMLEEVRDLCVE